MFYYILTPIFYTQKLNLEMKKLNFHYSPHRKIISDEGRKPLDIHEMTFYFNNLIDIIQTWMNSSQNTENKKYDPLSIINSPMFGNGEQKRIYHEPEIHFKKRGIICYTPIIIPER